MSDPKGKDEERRRFERLARRDTILVKEFSYPERGEYQEARIIDISGGGLQIECQRLFAEKSILKIEMNLTGWQRFTPGFLKHFGQASSRPLVVLAEVIRCKAVIPGARYEAALVFTGIDESHRLALIRFILSEIIAHR